MSQTPTKDQLVAWVKGEVLLWHAQVAEDKATGHHNGAAYGIKQAAMLEAILTHLHPAPPVDATETQ